MLDEVRARFAARPDGETSDSPLSARVRVRGDDDEDDEDVSNEDSGGEEEEVVAAGGEEEDIRIT